MKRFLILVAVVMMCLTVPAASRGPAVHVIRHDDGGVLIKYIGRYVGWDDNGDLVRLDGKCMSACTLILGTFDNDRLCATRRAQFGFHSAIKEGEYTADGTAFMWFFYGAHVRRALARREWNWPSYHPEFLMIDAQELVRPCE
jgi:hypothetical protein